MLNDVVLATNNVLYTWVLIPLLVGAGLYFTIRCRGVQIRYFFTGIKLLMERPADKAALSPFQALMISTASRVGVGNITGVATAIAIAGPGAVFWMWFTATLGAASAFVESTLAQVYKVRDGKSFRGGPSYYIQRALGKRWLGIAFSVSLIACYAYGFNALQANNMVAAVTNYTGDSLGVRIALGLVLAAIVAVTIWRGQRSISWVTSVMVPIMALIYLALGFVVIGRHLGQVPDVFGVIFEGAFDVKAIFGGFAGSAVMWGIKRGLFSNEAGMGSAPNAAASAETSHPAKQGMVQMLSVFIDTILICSTSAFLILMPGIPTAGEEAMPLVQAAVRSQFGEVGVGVITLAVLLFAFSSVIGNYYYTESNMFFIRGKHTSLRVFRGTVIAAVFVGAMVGYDLAWNMADFFMAFMTIINVVAIVLLGGIASRVLQDFVAQKREGKDPVFVASHVGLTNTDLWKDDVDEPGRVTATP